MFNNYHGTKFPTTPIQSFSLVHRPFCPSIGHLQLTRGKPGKTDHVQWHDGWTCGGVPCSFCTAVKRLSELKKHHQDCLISSTQSLHGLCLWSVVHSLEIALWKSHSFTHPPNVAAHDQFYQAFPLHASDECWGEKAWERSYSSGLKHVLADKTKW